MPLKGSAFLALWNDVDPARDAEYDRWHTFEHVPERVGISGILSGRRYVARERSEGRYFTLYELEGLATLAGPEYADVVERPTEWSLSMRPSLRHFQRLPCTALLSLGSGIAGSIATFRFAFDGTVRAVDAGAAKPVLEQFLDSAGITSIHLGQPEPDAAFPVKNAPASVATGAVTEFVLLAEGIARAALDDVAPAIVGAVKRAFATCQAPLWRTFDLAYTIDRASLPHSITHRQPERRELRLRPDVGDGKD